MSLTARQPRPVDSAMAESGRSGSTNLLARSLDLVSDWGVLAFAAWTLIAYIGMATQARVSLLVPIWVAAAGILGLVAVFVPRSRLGRATGKPSPVPAVPPSSVRRRSRSVVAVAVMGVLGSAVLVVARAPVPWAVVWAGGAAAVVAAVWLGRLGSPGRGSGVPEPGWPAHALAALAGLGLGVMSLFINRPNADDAFYVNRAAATADLNRIPVRDVLFTDELVPPTGAAGLPVDSFSALEGAVARFVGVHGASVAYYVVPPVMTFLAVWALWRLLRSWAPRNLVLCFALGSLYWLLSAQSGLMAGSFFLTRMWQGKVVFVAWLVPTLYTYLTRWLTRRDALTAMLLLAGGLASIGMTSSAAHLGPLLFLTAALALVARRDWRGLPVVLVAAAIPLVVGLVAIQKYPLPDRLGTVSHGTRWFIEAVIGVGFLAALALAALWVVPWLARSGPAASLTTAIAVVGTLLLTPSVLPLLAELVGVTENLRRMLWIVPLPAVVGLLAAVPTAELLGRHAAPRPLVRRAAVLVPSLLVATLLLAFGQPLWKSASGELLFERPTWKARPQALTDARTILSLYSGPGPILAAERTMAAIALVTVEPRAVNARTWYALLTLEPGRRLEDRLLLTRFIARAEPAPTHQEVAGALERLRVDLVCARGSQKRLLPEIRMSGRFREAFAAGGLVCLQRE